MKRMGTTLVAAALAAMVLVVLWMVARGRWQGNEAAGGATAVPAAGPGPQASWEWTLKDGRIMGYQDPCVQLALVGDDGIPVPCRLLELYNVNELKKDGVADSLDGAQSLLVPLLDALPKDRSVGNWLVAGHRYLWFYGTTPDNRRKRGGEVVMPGLVPGQSRYVVGLRPDKQAEPEPVGVELAGTLPVGIPEDAPWTINYLMDGQWKIIPLTPGKRDFRIRIPAYGGELMMEGGKRRCAYLYQKKVGGPTVEAGAPRDPAELRRFPVRYTMRADPATLDFLTGPDSRLPVAWIKIRQGEGEGQDEVALIPGRYWVRYHGRDMESVQSSAPFTDMNAADGETLDFTAAGSLPDVKEK